MKKKVIAFMLCFALLLIGSGCGAKEEKSSSQDSIQIAYQYGIAYAPLLVCQQNELIEKAYKEATGKDVSVTWTQMNSGADMNTALVSGSVQVGFMGVGPAINGISKQAGYKVFTNLSGQEHGLMTNQKEITSLADLIGSDKQIALVNIGSIQHIILAKALAENGYDAHALDANLVAMKHPDGKSSLESGSIPCHLTTNPYLDKERENENLYELPEIATSWEKDDSFIVGVASEKWAKENEELYTALCNAIQDAVEFVSNQPEETAQITMEYDGNSLEEEILYLQKGIYTTKTKGLLELAQFMYENQFISQPITEYSELVFDGVEGD